MTPATLSPEVTFTADRLRFNAPESEHQQQFLSSPPRAATALPNDAEPAPQANTELYRWIQKLEIQLAAECEQFAVEAGRERFADGVDSAFSFAVQSFIAKYSDAAVRSLYRLLASRKLTSVGELELIRALGRSQDESSHGRRFQVLVKVLGSEQPAMRDEAALSLLDLGDVRARQYVQAAAERELVPMLKLDLQATAAQIE